MSVVSRKEFAAICGDDVNSTNVYVGRKKIILVDPGKRGSLIDTENALNKIFIKQRQEFNNTPKVKKEAKPIIVKDVKKVEPDYSTKQYGSTKKETPTARKKRIKINEDSEIIANLETRKKKAEVLKVEREAELKLLDINKKNGESLPTDFVVMMFKNFTRSVLSKFESETINLAGVFCDILAGGDRKKLSEINHKLSLALQKVIYESKNEAKKDMTNTIREYSVKKGRGERG